MNKPPPNDAPRNYLGRREQIRLLMLIFSLGLILILIGEAAKPKNWYWLWGNRPPEASSAKDGRPMPPDEWQPVDTRLRPEGRAIEPFEPRIVAGGNSSDDADWEDLTGVVYAEHLMPGVRRADLEAIRDDVAFGSEENAIFYRWLVQCSRLGSRRLAERSLGATTYLQLFKQGEVYRGRVVSLQGIVRRAIRMHANSNESGVETYYQLWLQPDDRPTLPIVVYCMRLPEGFPVATEIREEIDLIAVPLKRWPYLAQDTMRQAPLVIAATVEWRPTIAATNTKITWLQLVMIVVAAATLAAMAVTLIAKRTNRSPLARHSAFAAAFQVTKIDKADNGSDDSTAVASMKTLAESEEKADERASDDEPIRHDEH